VSLKPDCWSTLVGSFPHAEAGPLCRQIVELVDVPAWPQLPRRNFRENMYVQYSRGMPGLVLDEDGERITFDTARDLTPELEQFYTRVIEDDLDSFGLTPDYATGFYTMLDVLRSTDGEWVKGQVTGPVSFGLTVVDQKLQSALYNEQLADPIVANCVMNARWQVRKLKELRPNVIVFIDEPYMASFGSAFVSLSREGVAEMLSRAVEAIHTEGGLAGTHCCGNTDWSVLMEVPLDILNFDAYGYVENLALYPAELGAFLERGGVLAWGIVPNNETIFEESVESLAKRLEDGFGLLADKAQARGVNVTRDLLRSRCLITTSCGLAPASVEVAERALETTARLAEHMRATGG
jgi:methionine synthase II (cobalamin-independent)